MASVRAHQSEMETLVLFPIEGASVIPRKVLPTTPPPKPLAWHPEMIAFLMSYWESPQNMAAE